MDRLGILTYETSPLNESLRARWCSSVLAKHLIPSISAARAAAMGNGFRELLALDAGLDSKLAGPSAKRSGSAGRMIAADFRPPAAERTLARYFTALEAGQSSGHLVTVLSARAAVFHISPQLTLSALVFLEMRAAPVTEFWACVEDCLRRTPQNDSLLRAA